MRQLKKEGWLHHICRNSLAIFLTRGQLFLTWELGLKTFLKYQIDVNILIYMLLENQFKQTIFSKRPIGQFVLVIGVGFHLVLLMMHYMINLHFALYNKESFSIRLVNILSKKYTFRNLNI